ncbi:ATP-binding protein [Halalkalibacter nanhaiisediminis]|uniref:histidine kinase n=1 Tax=Halalkalibacter nanhaiisediminis TaxID=688079 RepID=A0A562QMF3_9BACI|nr:ATP-binding protein [Halalkalibacter nanhaiisediminis]TWI57932.1 phospho-acceptor domain-containing protein [Halalkalibacter nanhaiisediminis]
MIGEIEEAVKLTNNINVSSGCHIIYTYSQIESYLDNATAFLAEGIDKRQVVIYIDTVDRFTIIKDKLKHEGYSAEHIENIIFEDSDDFYRTKDLFSINQILHYFTQVLDPYLKEKRTIRTWSDVRWKDQDEEALLKSLKKYECECDTYIGKVRTISVCSYNGFKLPSAFLIDLLQSHEYHMTDKTLVPSSFYNKKQVLFPSISEQIRMEKATQDQLIRSEKLSIAGQLAAGIAHEIRNPITTIKGFLQLLEVNEKNVKYINILEGEVNKIEQISNEFLILSKPHLENRKDQNIVELIEGVTVLLQPQAVNKNIGIQTTYESQNIIVNCDDMKIKQVLINLIKNAIEAMENGYITIKLKETSHHVIIYITDEGHGIPKERLTELGKPFFTTKEKGTGLGLLVCYKIIEDHHGTIVVESEEGKGTTFTISLPKT